MLHWCGNGGGAGSFSILFPVSGKQGMEEVVDGGGGSYSSVDCTLTLGTPYTRHLSSSYSLSSFGSESGKHDSSASVGGGLPASAGGRGGGNLSGDPFLLARRCANCDTTSTPLWRNGPRGPKSLCNACGIRYKKEERRAAASSTAMGAQPAGDGISYNYTRGQLAHPWGCYTPAVKSSAVTVFAGESEEQRELYIPWRLNVVPQQFPAVSERGGLSQYQ